MMSWLPPFDNIVAAWFLLICGTDFLEISSHSTVIDFHFLSHNWRTAYSYIDEDTPIGKGTMLLTLSER
jgi:hypothetical protein